MKPDPSSRRPNPDVPTSRLSLPERRRTAETEDARHEDMSRGHPYATWGGHGPITSLVGRENELDGLLESVLQHGLVTITGAPGIGKSRLALEAANRLSATGAVEAVVVAVAPLGEAEQVSAAVARALGMGQELGPAAAAVSSPVGQPVLVVLDDCDHLLAACAQVAEQLLAADVRVLVTSREPLRTPAETVWQLPPLSLPEAGFGALPEAFVDSEAVQLFCVRSAAAAQGFVPTPDNIAAIVEICRGLDGLALAIELAAARIGVLSPAEMAAQLDDPLRLLTRAPRTAPPRHQSLRAALEWSWEVLSWPEQVLLGRLSVFAASFKAEAVGDVCAGSEVRADVLDVLSALVEKSLVVAEAVGGRTRYRLFGVIRHFAADKLVAAGEADARAARHVRWCAALVASAGDHRREGRCWVERLEPEGDEIVAAFEWAGARGLAEAATRLGMAEVLLRRARGDHAGAQALLKRVLSLAADAPAPLRAGVLCDAGAVVTSQGDSALAAARLEASMAAAREADDVALVARARSLSALASVLVGDVPAGLAALDDAVALGRSAGDDDCLAEALAAYGTSHLLVGNVEVAHQAFAQSRDLAGELGNRTALANALLGLGSAGVLRGDYDDAERDLTDALRTAGDVADPYVAVMTLAWLGELARLRGDDQGAERLMLECVRMADEAGLPYPRAKALVGLGRLAQARGDLGQARRWFDEGLGLSRARGLAHLVSPCLHGLAQLAWAGGAEDTAQSLLEEALAFAEACLDKGAEAQALDELARMVAARGDHQRADRLHHRALALRCHVGDPAEIADSLEGLGALRASSGDGAAAARLFGAAHSLRSSHACVRQEHHRGEYESAVALAHQGLGADRFDAEWLAGEGLSMDEAVAKASRPRRRAKRPPSGPEALTPAEREVAVLAAAGLTNEAIAKQLVVSRRTVETHLQRTYSKLGISSRSELGAKIGT